MNTNPNKKTSQPLNNVSDYGFTLIELMVASVLALVLMLSTTAILFQTFEFIDRQRIRMELNTAARETFNLLGDGGCCDATTNPTERFRGVRARDFLNDGRAECLRAVGKNNARLQLDIVDADGCSAFAPVGPELSGVTINCRGADDPIQGCTPNGTVAVTGYLAQDPRLYNVTDSLGNFSDRSVDDSERQADRTIEVEFMLLQPHSANRPRFRSEDIRESYRTIFTFNRTE